MADLKKANKVMAEMEQTYGRRRARKMACNTLDALYRYDDESDARPFLEQLLEQIVSTFENCGKLKK